MITSKKVFKVADTLAKMVPHANRRKRGLHMGESRVYETIWNMDRKIEVLHPCGTIHCHAGWYYLAKHWDKDNDRLVSRRHDTGKLKLEVISYRHGAERMAKDLGFNCQTALENWARENPRVWGNEHGGLLFTICDAFDKDAKADDDKPLTLADIVEHWRGVGERLKKLENGGEL